MSAVKKVVKKVGKFIKKNWKKIVIAAAVVFTAGLATVGMAAFSGASGFGGFMAAAGQTLVAGGQAILGTVGIGSGVSVGTGAGGALSAFKGATLLNGTMAQTLGLATRASTGASAAAAGANVGSAVGVYSGPGSSMIGGGGSLFGGGTTAAQTAARAAAAGSMGPPSTLAAAGGGGAAGAGAGAGAGASTTAAPAGGGLFRQALVGAIPGAISAYANGRAAEQQAEDEKPQQFWGVDLKTGENHYQSLSDEQPSPPSLAKPVKPKKGLAAIKANQKRNVSYKLRTDEAENAAA